MQEIRSGKITTIGLLVIVLSIAAVIATAFFGVLRTIFVEVQIMVTEHRVDSSNMAFILLVTMFAPAYYLIRRSWLENKSFIAISESHLPVDPCNRRDEYLDVTPSYIEMQSEEQVA